VQSKIVLGVQMPHCTPFGYATLWYDKENKKLKVVLMMNFIHVTKLELLFFVNVTTCFVMINAIYKIQHLITIGLSNYS